MTTDREKEVNRLKQSRRNAVLNLVAKRLGFSSWSNFGREFYDKLSTLPKDATEAQVNAEIDLIVSLALEHIFHNATKQKTPDDELSAVLKAHPISRKWNYKPKKPTP